MYGFSWYSNDPRYSFRAAVKDLFDGFNQNCYDCKDPLALRICSLIKGQKIHYSWLLHRIICIHYFFKIVL